MITLFETWWSLLKHSNDLVETIAWGEMVMVFNTWYCPSTALPL